MTEAEILAELATRTELIWGLVQWWASLSLAMIAVGYLSSKQDLTLVMLIPLITAYALYSWMIAMAVQAQTGFVGSAVSALQALENSDGLGPMGRYAVNELTGDTSETRGLLIVATCISVFVVTILYPIYSYWHSHHRRNA